MKDSKKGLLHVLLVLVAIALLGYVAFVGVGKGHRGTAKNIKLGLDLAGGVSITYETVKENPTAEEMSDTINKMQKRAETYSTESAVYQEGSNRITIDIPGEQDADAVLESLGKAGALEFVMDSDMDVDDEGNPVYEKARLTGSHIKNAQAVRRQQETTGAVEFVVQLTMTAKGAKKFAKATQEAYAAGKAPIHIVYDGEIISSPNVQAEITNGEAIIEGGFSTFDDADELASLIRIGALPLELTKIRSSVEGAQLGLDAISTSLMAGLIGFALVVIFMIVLYRIPGLASSVALVLYLGMMAVTLNVLDVTLTLPGIAGILLNIGMAVDANVIIFTRIKEELYKGKAVRSAIKTGFDKALSAIVDGNVTTLIAAAVLYLKGSGTVKGFATTLAIGIVLSMFTALFVTRVLLYAFYNLGLDDVKYFGQEKKKKTIDFVGNRKKFFAISGVLMLACVVMLVVNNATIGSVLNYGLDFLGGTSMQITFDSENEVNDALKERLEATVSDAAGSNDVIISEIANANALTVKTVDMNETQIQGLLSALNKDYGVTEDNITMDNISASVSQEMRMDAIVAVIIAAICMLLYIWFRFKDLTFAGSAVIALLHDVVVVLLVYAAARISVGNTFIACMLTIVGYSINATIVIFDRIRENLGGKKSAEAIKSVVNESITQTFTRSINTSLTTFIMVAALVVLGVDSIREFAIPMAAGIICGAYSSICVTGTLWYSLKKKK